MPRGIDRRSPREASSDASLWSDDLNDTFAEISTPPLPQDRALPALPSHGERYRENTASNPITIPDSTNEPCTQRHGLEHELFPSGQLQPSSSSTKSRSHRGQPPSSFDFEAAAGNEPWSQKELRATQHLRDEWLISVGQKQPTDLVEDYIPRMNANPNAIESEHPHHTARSATNEKSMPSTLSSASAGPAHSDSPANSTARRGRSSLLDQLDMICSSSPSSSSSQVEQRSSTSATTATEPNPLRPITSLVNERRAKAAVRDVDKQAAHGVLDISCSPPSPRGPQMMLIKDMPPEKQEIYRRLAFGGSSSTSQATVGTTVRGTRGKTWQTTWQDERDGSDGNGHVAGSTSGLNSASGSELGGSARRGAAISATSSSRGRKTSALATGARKGVRKSSSGSGSSATKSRSRFFASKAARGGWRGRGRGR